jgi:hypothetical protein
VKDKVIVVRGHGVIHYKSGAIYTGKIKNFKPHGFGKIVIP